MCEGETGIREERKSVWKGDGKERRKRERVCEGETEKRRERERVCGKETGKGRDGREWMTRGESENSEKRVGGRG